MKKIIVRRSASIPHGLRHLDPVLQRVYAARGIASAEDLERSLEYLLPYHSLLGIEQAARCLGEAIKQQQRILILGDFDADGATSTALAVAALKSLGARDVCFLVPNRFVYGHGLSPELAELAAQQQPQWLVTVDNGITSCAGAAAAKALGMRVIITDHHLPGEQLPDVEAIVNPNQPNDPFPCKNLAGVGVIFYVMLALRSYLRDTGWFSEQNIEAPNMSQFLDLVALGTVADMVPLDRNNRILVYQGVQRIKAGKCRFGISALMDVAGRTVRDIATSDLGFVIGPRLNAAGRLDDMSLGIACLLADTWQQARAIAQELDQLNQQRRLIEVDMQQQAAQFLQRLSIDQQKDMPYGLCLFNKTWHQGVIGILAGRIKEQFYRPVIVFTSGQDDEIKGSARSIPGVHIRDVLTEIEARCPGLMRKFGGHAMAAGVSLAAQNYQQFTEVFDLIVRQHLAGRPMQGEVVTDGELQANDMTIGLTETLQQAGPWGQAFPEPLFDGQFHLLQHQILKDRHLKLRLAVPNTGYYLDGLAFNVDLDHWLANLTTKVRLAYRLAVNEFRGERNLQLLLDHVEPGS